MKYKLLITKVVRVKVRFSLDAFLLRIFTIYRLKMSHLPKNIVIFSTNSKYALCIFVGYYIVLDTSRVRMS